MQYNKQQIIALLKENTLNFFSTCDKVSEAAFFSQPASKWSIAQNVAHLITSANMTRLAYRLPKLIVRIYSGKPNRPSKTYDELVTKYLRKLSEGGKASGQFDTKLISASRGKDNLLRSYNRSMEILINSIDSRWTEKQFDQYLAPHPLLGKLTLRELAYFTIYHLQHHLRIVNERLSGQM